MKFKLICLAIDRLSLYMSPSTNKLHREILHWARSIAQREYCRQYRKEQLV